MTHNKLSSEDILQLANEVFSIVDGERLNNNQAKALELIHDEPRITYSEVGGRLSYTENYISKDVVSEIWKKLSKGLETGEYKVKVSRSNYEQCLIEFRNRKRQSSDSGFKGAGGPVPLNSHFYIERDNVDSLCYGSIQYHGLLRIKGHRRMGKTSLLLRILKNAEEQGHQTVFVNFRTDKETISDLKKCLQYICRCVSKELEIEDQLDQFWKETYSPNVNASNYFEDYLLKKLDTHLVLVLDNFDRIFQESISEDVCHLMRSWYDHGMTPTQSDEHGWKKLCLVIAHSTDEYGTLDLNNSPLGNMGQVVTLEDFSKEQVVDLARRHGLNMTCEIEQLMNLLDGHPYLVQLAFQHLKSCNVSLERLSQIAITEVGPFGDHLRLLLGNLENLGKNSELKTVFYQVIKAAAPVRLKSNAAFQLQSMGLIKSQSDGWIPVCELYRTFFLNELEELPKG